MRRATRFAILPVMLAMVSACGQQERPRTASDSCLIFNRISLEVAPAAGIDDPGNKYDSDPTVNEVLGHNAAWDAACGGKDHAAR